MIRPRATEILAAAATKHGLSFILSTVATASIETVAEITGGKAWFQLYHPVEEDLRNKLLDRVEAAGLPALVILADTPAFGYRPREIRNGLAMPPKMTLRNIAQMMTRPHWSFAQLATGVPEFATLKPYLPGGLDMKHLGLFMNRTFSGRLNPARLASLRDRWKGKLVVKGLVSEEDVETALGIGVDGVIVSNHGGRQLDAGESTIAPLTRLARRFGDRTTLMLDSGLRSGPDIACALASGARFGFLGRSFMYGVAALGGKGGTVALHERRAEFTSGEERRLVIEPEIRFLVFWTVAVVAGPREDGLHVLHEVDRAVRRGRQFGEIGLGQFECGRVADDKTLGPGSARVDPGAEFANLFRLQRLRFLRRHRLIGIDPGDAVDEIGLGAFAIVEGRAVFPALAEMLGGVEPEPALLLARPVA